MFRHLAGQIHNCVENAIFLDDLDAKGLKQRRVFFYLNVVLSWTAIATISFPDSNTTDLQVLGVGATLLSSLFALIMILCKRQVTTALIVGVIYFQSAVILYWDLSSRTIRKEAWPLLVLCVDILLVMQVKTRYTIGLVCVVVGWLMVLGLEEGYRFGLLDAPGLRTQESRREFFMGLMSCTDLPCATEVYPSQGLYVAISVFLVDFFATRGFARDVLKEQAAMERTIATVQEIAGLLAGYDVEAVALRLDTHSADLPEKMTTALRSLETNLRGYRPYLPAALFENTENENYQCSVLPPATEAGSSATIVFTDIISSTSLWENFPVGMHDALRVHNTLLRSVMTRFGGYEVKTIGDAFMIAFSSTEEGIRFGLSVNEALLDAEWPTALLEESPLCSQGTLWKGLTIRIGVNSGEVTTERNDLTGRTDYFGHTVNMASRLESSCIPGAVAVLCDVWTACSDVDAVVGDSVAVKLKGVCGASFVCSVWPISLAGRKENPFCVVLPNANVKIDRDGGSSPSGSISSLGSSPMLSPGASPISFKVCTVGVIDVVEDGLQSLSGALVILTAALEQSGGKLVSVLGGRVCVGWNVVRVVTAHMECAVRFAQNSRIAGVARSAGLASGAVQCGAVGARTQRFIVLCGETVRRSWTLCDAALGTPTPCFFEPPDSTILPTALEQSLTESHHPKVYSVNLEDMWQQ